jgi:hypothetical protein
VIKLIVKIKEEWIKPVVNIACFLFLFGLTVYGLVHITNNPILQGIIGLVAFILDAYMLFILSKAKYLWSKGLIIDQWKAAGYFTVYTIYTILYVFLFAIGFFLAELDTNEQVITNSNTVYEINIAQIKSNQAQINAYVIAQAAENKTTRGKNAKEIETLIAELKNENSELSKGINQTSNKSMEVSTNFLLSLAKVFGLKDTRGLKILLFGVLVLLLQFCLISSSFNIAIDEKEKVKELDDFKKKLLIFLDALFEGRNKSGLKKDIPVNGIRTISELTKMPEDECIGYRDYLETLKVNGGYAITVTQGGTTANYPKEFIRNFIINH